MGLFDIFKKGKSTVAQHEDKIDSAIDKAADVADDKTGGAHTDKIESAAEGAKDVVDKITDAD